MTAGLVRRVINFSRFPFCKKCFTLLLASINRSFRSILYTWHSSREWNSSSILLGQKGQNLKFIFKCWCLPVSTSWRWFDSLNLVREIRFWDFWIWLIFVPNLVFDDTICSKFTRIFLDFRKWILMKYVTQPLECYPYSGIYPSSRFGKAFL